MKTTPETPATTEQTGTSPTENVQTVHEDGKIEEAEVVSTAPQRSPYIEMAQDDKSHWHWCLWSANGRAIAGSMTTYPKRNDCQKAVETAMELFRNTKLKIVTQVGN